jgi:hypothetical protein
VRIAVQREDPSHSVQHSRRDRVDRAAGHQLLGRLEDQPHSDRRLRRRRQCQRGPEQNRGVRVMAAGVRDVGHIRGIGRSGALCHGQCVHVGPQCDPGPMLGAEVAGEAGTAGQYLRVEPGIG